MVYCAAQEAPKELEKTPTTTGKMNQLPRQLELSLLGRPTSKKKEQARKINELKLFNGRLYVGHGSYSANTGPTDIISYHLATGKFRTEGSVDDEAIVQYKNFGGHLVIPGIDATEDWSFGNCYVLEKTGWVKHRSIPKALHVYGITEYEGRWYACTHSLFEFAYGTRGQPGVGMIMSSGDRGATWQFEYATPCDVNADGFVKNMVVFKGRLYGFPSADTFPNTKEYVKKEGKRRQRIPDPYASADTVVYDGSLWRGLNLIEAPNVLQIVPIPTSTRLGLLVRFKNAKGKRSETYQQLYAYDGKTAARVAFDDEAVKDILCKPDETFLLMKRGGKWLIAATRDLERWVYYAIARVSGTPQSIEHDGSAFYIGTSDGSVYKSKPFRVP